MCASTIGKQHGMFHESRPDWKLHVMKKLTGRFALRNTTLFLGFVCAVVAVHFTVALEVVSDTLMVIFRTCELIFTARSLTSRSNNRLFPCHCEKLKN
jgi:hypothetical protein